MNDPLPDILIALRDGTVPGDGVDRIAVGNESILEEITSQLNRVKSGKSGFKFLIGDYGSGKTFLSKLIQKKAFEKGFVVSFITISQETPLHKFEDLFRSIMDQMQTAEYKKECAISLLIEEWLLKLEEKIIENHHLLRNRDSLKLQSFMDAKIDDELSIIGEMESSFARAIRTFYRARLNRNSLLAQSSIGWLKGEHIRAEIKKEIEVKGDMSRSSSFIFFRAWIRMIKTIGYDGLILIFDELETIQKLRTVDMRIEAFSNLRLFIDESDKNSFPYCYFLFTGTNTFLECEKGIRSYEPLYQRVIGEKDKSFPNLREPIIFLNRMNKDNLFLISKKIMDIHSQVYRWNPEEKITDEFLTKMINELTRGSEIKGRIYPRGYLRIFVDLLDKSQQYKDYIPEEMFQFTEDILKKANEVEDKSFILEKEN